MVDGTLEAVGAEPLACMAFSRLAFLTYPCFAIPVQIIGLSSLSAEFPLAAYIIKNPSAARDSESGSKHARTSVLGAFQLCISEDSEELQESPCAATIRPVERT